MMYIILPISHLPIFSVILSYFWEENCATSEKCDEYEKGDYQVWHERIH